MTRDRIQLIGLRAKGFHGVFEFEKRDGQEFVVDAVLHVDTSAAANSDDLADTVDYGGLSGALVEVITGPPFDLIEALAGQLAEVALAAGGPYGSANHVAAVDISVHKPQAPLQVGFSDVIVSVHRQASVAAVIALGSNLGDRVVQLRTSIEGLAAHPDVQVTGISPFVETDPVGGPEQPDYLNGVVTLSTTLPPSDLLALCQQIEADHERVRETRWGPRTVDLDLIDYGGVRQVLPGLTLPHPRAGERAFVLVPWAALDPDAILPTATGPQPVAQLAELAPDRPGVRPWSSDGEHDQESS